jgi:hypothetical protein
MVEVGHFVSESAFDHFATVYRAGMAQLPPFDVAGQPAGSASLTLLDPVLTFVPIPSKALVVSA